MRNVAQCCVYVTGEEESALNRYYLTITRLRSENPGPREELAQGLLEILLFFFKTTDRMCCSSADEEELCKNGALRSKLYFAFISGKMAR